MQLANFDGILVETSKDALCHQFYVVDASW
jgi:hypothetical protein